MIGEAPATMPSAVNFMGLPIHPLTMQQSIALAKQFIVSGGHHQHIVLNADTVVQAQTNEKLNRIIGNSSMVTADGQSVVWASRLLGCALPERIAGVDLMLGLWSCSARNGFRVYLLGADQESLEGTVASALSLGVNVVGSRNGYWSSGEEDSVVEEVRAANPDLLFVAIPSPRKECFISEHLDDLGTTLAIGVGGAFDVVSGRITRAPRWMQEAGLEWAYRLIQEPRRLFRRYLVGNIRFILMVLRSRLSIADGRAKS